MSRPVVIAHSDESEELFSYYALRPPPIVVRSDKPVAIVAHADPPPPSPSLLPSCKSLGRRARKTEAEKLVEAWEAIKQK
jgi:hypothetical protein